MGHTRPVVLFVVSLLVLSFASVLPASAQTGVGPYIGTEIGQENTFPGISARFAAGPFQLAPSVEASFMDGFSHWQLNADILYGFGVREALLTPYLGAGFSLRNAPGTSTSPGANAIAGVGLNLGPLVPFVQSRMTVAGGTNLTVMGGLIVTPTFRRK